MSPIRMQFDFNAGGLVDLPEAIRDQDCTVDTPVVYGKPVDAVYGKGVKIVPRIKGRKETEHDKAHYLEELLPLEEYDKIVVFFSSGKDSLACVLYLLELGVPKDRIELWHHLIDEGSDKKMDHPVTLPYTKAVAQALRIRLRFSWREGGFWSEGYRLGSTAPVTFEDNDGLKTIEPKAWQRTQELKAMMDQAELEDNANLLSNCYEELKKIGYRMKFPAKGADLSTRYCSAYLKVMIGSSVIIHSSNTKSNCKLLVVSGERRGESNNRRRYNEIEKHGTNAEIKNKRIVHVWRPIIDHSLTDVWHRIARHRIRVNPVYEVGMNRVSCALCIFNSPAHWAGIKEQLYGSGKGSMFQQVVDAEKELGFTLDNKVDINTFVGDALSCVDRSNAKAVDQVQQGVFNLKDVFLSDGETWVYPTGAFRANSYGGPC